MVRDCPIKHSYSMSESTAQHLPNEPKLNESRRIFAGTFALLLWLLLFSSGLLINSLESREKLGWKSDKTELQLENLNRRIEAIEASPAPALVVTQPVAVQTKPTEETSQPRADTNWEKFRAFFVATFTYLPVNVGMLCVVAAFLGGCSVSKEMIEDIKHQLGQTTSPGDQSELVRRLIFLTEHPAFSAFRGLVIFLILGSGLLVLAGAEALTDNPDQADAIARYIRYASLFSFVGYLAGHDPTIFSNLISLGTNRLKNPPSPKS